MGMAEYSAQHTIEYLASEFRKENLRPVSEQQARFRAQSVYCSLESIAPEYVDQNLQTSVSETDLKKMTVNVYYKSSALKTEKSVQLTSLISKK